MTNYLKEAKNAGTYAGDIEISTACILFGCNLRIYIRDANTYKFNEYNEKNNGIKDLEKEVINILFVSCDHFELLISKIEKRDNIATNIIKKIDINKDFR